MATDIIARGMAANAKKSVTALGNKIESEKWIGTKAEWEAVDKSTIKDGTIVYITDDKTVILYDKVEMEKIAAQVATDRKAAETAAQTAQSIADSLPDDYTTAVEKIDENTAEIANVKLTDKELQRRVNALYDIGQGITHKFETDSETAYQKAVPTGGKLMSVKNVGGKSLVWNQMCSTFTYQGTECNCKPVYSAHKYLCRIDCEAEQGTTVYMYFREVIYTKNNQISKSVNAGKSTLSWITSPYGDSDIGGTFDAFLIDNSVKVTFSNRQIFDLTAMFGAGNEPTTVEEFEKIFPAAYYPYNAGEIVSAGTEEVAVGDTAHKIPEAIKALPGYGWSAGTAKNYVDYENKKYYQCVDSMDLGTLNWNFNTTSGVGNHFYGRIDPAKFKYLGSFGTTVYNVLCSKYRTVSRSSSVFVDKTITIDGVNTIVSQIQVKDSAYTDAAAFQQAMQGVILYYELANPIVTDISTMIPDDFLRNLTVEAGGSVTFKNRNDSYRIPVPSEEEYIVKLSEVGGSV